MELSGHTTPYAVLGHPIGHSLSPVMHNASIRAMGLDAIYQAFDVHPDRLMEVLPAMRDMGFGGVNLTVPLKEVAFRGLAQLDQSARLAGAVNTVEMLADGELKGHSTDGFGFVKAIAEAFDRSVQGLSVFVLGTGGAGRTVAIICAGEGAARIAVTDLDPERPEKVRGEIAAAAPTAETVTVPADPAAWAAAAREADLVVQSTPVGMKEADASLLPPSAFKPGQLVFDLVYMYPETTFMKAARKGGAEAANGLGMLLHQGARAFSIWTGTEPDIEAMRGALEGEVYGAA